MTDLHDTQSATRLAIVQALYQIEISGNSCDLVAEQFLLDHRGAIGVDEKIKKIDRKNFFHMLTKIHEGTGILDNTISSVLSDRWSMDRLGATMRALMRSACYELTDRPDVPARVVIKEYVDMARGFHDLEETGFVNASLDNLARSLRGAEMKMIIPKQDSEKNGNNSE